jgi:polysaccharide deacetylase family protein (PEP-CTERM system associated)
VNQINKIEVPYNFITIDVEDWFHVLNTKIPNYKEWENLPSIVEKGTNKILDILDETDSKSTFFVLGWIAEKYPSLVKEIDKRGHEVASHGYYHKELYKMNDEEIKEDIIKSKNILEQTIGKEVIGYRAPGFSSLDYIKLINLLSKLGFKYDASVFPAKRETGGDNHFDSNPFYINVNQNKFYEFPISVYKNRLIQLPLGGGYSRITPNIILNKVIKKSKKSNSDYFMFYFHPREVLKKQQKLKNLNFKKYFKTYIGIKNFQKKIKKILNKNRSDSIKNIINAIERIDRNF